MKKALPLFLLVVSASLSLAGCNPGDKNAADSSWEEGFKKTQKVEVRSSDSSDVIASISDDKDIKKFIDELKLDDWYAADLPSESDKGKIFKMYQEDTVKLGESGKQKGDLKEIATMTTYKDVPYIEFSVNSYSFSFKIPGEVAEYLNSK